MKRIVFIFSLLIIQNAFAQSFLDEFNGKTVSCEISSYNEEMIPSFFRTSFILQDIIITFDSEEMQSSYQGGQLIENLYSIKYELESSQGKMQFFFNMDYSKAVFSREGHKHILSYKDDFKSYRLEFSNGLIRDKYKFIKNGEVQFTCRSFFDYR